METIGPGLLKRPSWFKPGLILVLVPRRVRPSARKSSLAFAGASLARVSQSTGGPPSNPQAPH